MNNAEKNILLSSNMYRNKRRFWIDKLAGELTFTNILPVKKSSVKEKKQFSEYEFILPDSLVKQILKISNKNILSQFVICMSAINILIYKYTEEEDIFVYSPLHCNCDKEQILNNYIIIREHITSDLTYKQCILKLKKTVAESFGNQEYPMEQVMNYLGYNSDSEKNQYSNVACTFKGVHLKTEMETDFQFQFSMEEETLKANIVYNSNRYKKSVISSLSSHFIHILKAGLENLDAPISQISMLDYSEIHYWLEEYNSTYDFRSISNIVRLFEKQVEMSPHRIAIENNGKSVTYQMLNNRVNQLARTLRQENVNKGDIIGILMDNSIQLVVAILAVLKSQATYLPIDTIYPAKRIEYMLRDSQTKLVLSDDRKPVDIEYDYRWVNLEAGEWKLNEQDNTNVELQIDGEDIAYLMYTSGTTGKPKGALIKHKGLANYISWAKELYLEGRAGSFPLYSSISFDLTVTSIYTPLISGGKIVVYNGSEKVLLIQKIIKDSRVDVLKLTPTHLGILEELECSECSIKKIIVGGENLKVDLVKRIQNRFAAPIQIYNEYGPTETVVGCMTYLYDERLETEGYVPIGIPAKNMRIYLMDHCKNFVPEGVVGEIYIAGAGVAKEYLNRPKITKEKFVLNPYYPEETMYRTGDYAKLLSIGNLLYVGRKDGQVKIRGFRIELDEIEAGLLKHPDIKEASVLALEADDGSRYITAYLVCNSKLNVKKLREYLMLSLPEYMVPKYFYKTDAIPVTINGKVDKTLLSESKELIDSGIDYFAPRTDIEKLLVSIYEEIMNINKVGIYDDFFSLGGDSIKAIRVSAKLQQYKMRVGIQDIYEYPTIEELSKYVEVNNREIDQGLCCGRVDLSPIQLHFFERPINNRNHYNQSSMLFSKEGFDVEIVKKVLEKLVEHHDALRMRYSEKEETWEQRYSDLSKKQFLFTTVTLMEEQIKQNQLEIQIDQIQRSLDIRNGPLISMAVFKTKQGDHLLIVVHHLVIDGVSFRILLDDFYTAYKAISRNEQFEFPKKTDSYQNWSNGIGTCLTKEELQKEHEYWKLFRSHSGKYIVKSNESAQTKLPNNKRYTIQMDSSLSKLLLTQLNNIYQTEITDIFLTALGLTVKELTGEERIVISVEGHGREELQKEMNITRTIGWFTSMFPVMLDMSRSCDLSYLIRQNKELLRKIPNKGIGYGIIKYLLSDKADRAPEYSICPEINFNYLGQITNEMNNNLFNKSNVFPGNNVDERELNEYSLDINGAYDGEKIEFSVKYDCNLYSEEMIQKFMDLFKNKLCCLINHCCSQKEKQFTPSDYGEKTMSIEELEIIQNLVKGISSDLS